MKIKNTEKFWKELSENLRELPCFAVPGGFTVVALESSEYKKENLTEENKKLYGCRKLDNPIMVMWYGDDNYHGITDWDCKRKAFFTIDEDGNSISMYYPDKEKQMYCWASDFDLYNYKNKTVLTLEIFTLICKIGQYVLKEGK